MASNSNSNYGTMQSEKKDSSRNSTDTTNSTEALIKKDSKDQKKGSGSSDKDKVSAKAIFSSRFLVLLLEILANPYKLRIRTLSRWLDSARKVYAGALRIQRGTQSLSSIGNRASGRYV